MSNDQGFGGDMNEVLHTLSATRSLVIGPLEIRFVESRVDQGRPTFVRILYSLDITLAPNLLRALETPTLHEAHTIGDHITAYFLPHEGELLLFSLTDQRTAPIRRLILRHTEHEALRTNLPLLRVLWQAIDRATITPIPSPSPPPDIVVVPTEEDKENGIP